MPAGAVVTVNVIALLGNPPTVTTTPPVDAPAGTGATIVVSFQLEGVAAVPLNETVLAPCVAPKFEPLMVTAVPTGPVVGFKDAIAGAAACVTAVDVLEYALRLFAASVARTR